MMTDCGLTADGPCAVFVDPGKYAILNMTATPLSGAGKYCLRARRTWKNLIDKANQSAAGGVIGSLQIGGFEITYILPEPRTISFPIVHTQSREFPAMRASSAPTAIPSSAKQFDDTEIATLT